MLGTSSIKQKNEHKPARLYCDLTDWHTPVDPPVHLRRGHVCSCWFLEKLCGLASSFFVCQKQKREHWAFVSCHCFIPDTMSVGTMRRETYIRVFSVGSGGTTSGSGCSSSGWQQSESKLKGRKMETKSCSWMNSDVKWKVHHAPDIKIKASLLLHIYSYFIPDDGLICKQCCVITGQKPALHHIKSSAMH